MKNRSASHRFTRRPEDVSGSFGAAPARGAASWAAEWMVRPQRSQETSPKVPREREWLGKSMKDMNGYLVGAMLGALGALEHQTNLTC